MQTIIFFVYAVSIYIALPMAFVIGWIRFGKVREPLNLTSVITLCGFVLGSSSALLAISSLYYGHFHNFRYYDPSLLRIYRWGTLLSLLALILSIAGARRGNALRWYAPLCALGMLIFWLGTAATE
ncbi:hypothetical protein HDF10_003262 [Edaphobacter lichenicola]|uniref:Uncharacterized protein n=1 Tax=Tunturiibacter lichenicola TaxID=2051959 RepID=A0A7W8N667_9BACT|nr:hypothetical protein [Edaphobacter lichenicola]